jgi:hypothetical protein
MTAASTTVKASEVGVGDRVRARSGTELTVEDSDEQWFKMPSLKDGDVELVRRA